MRLNSHSFVFCFEVQCKVDKLQSVVLLRSGAGTHTKFLSTNTWSSDIIIRVRTTMEKGLKGWFDDVHGHVEVSVCWKQPPGAARV